MCIRDRETDLPVRKMSRGNRQKVAIVTALAHDPKVVVLDEPTSGLDPLMQETLADCLRELAQAGHTVFFSSHTLSEVELLCDRVGIVRDGVIVADDQLQNLKAIAPRTATLAFANEEAAQNVAWPEATRLVRTYKTKCVVTLEGSSTDFVKWASELPIADISISPPNLEALFRGYYETAPESVATAEVA